MPEPRRSALYMPGANARAMAKAVSLPADVLIFDLEDAVDAAAKLAARDNIRQAFASNDYGPRERVLRINSVGSVDWQTDLSLALELPGLDAVLVPKVADGDQMAAVASRLDASPGEPALGLWPMIETPAGALDVAKIAAASARNQCLVLGTQDLAKALRLPADRARLGMLAVLSGCVLAARAHGLDVLDGVHPDFRDQAGLESVCSQGRGLGFDGKTLIHPAQIETANLAFGPDPIEVAEARRLIEAWATRPAGAGVVSYEGRMVESLHVEQARELVEFAQACVERQALTGSKQSPARRP